MAWLSIIVSVGVTWVASLYKILNSSRSQSNSVFSRTGDKRNVLLVIAHPDDESMFFSPTINYMTSRAHNVFILCMSTGNADGMGNIRKDELYRACAVFKVPPEHVKILDQVDFQDGFGKVWNHNLLAKIVEEEVITHAIDLVRSFVNNFLTETSRGNTEAWELISTNIFRKYSGPLDIWLSILSSAMHYPRGKFQCLLNEHPGKSFLAMSEHRSQWVWFRKLFVSFSSYSYVNTLRRINN
ncbi:N-acetylglucosaminyl-phosphatidylinositol de-N-acetylase-like isoform X4 [Mangifera indica]|uniref:N-acetylglucosaminyl-phosphatidylinositol de-N-acetylase-like isoform X4 n=1 Tax=Mangifera indica TaxID=29780 RepID=UPI001CF93D8C|nr:N-acetylglucosaminyl-phosphatidylinositol de-N-acetylase-like isoform X4 [Mangifera indica]